MNLADGLLMLDDLLFDLDATRNPHVQPQSNFEWNHSLQIWVSHHFKHMKMTPGRSAVKISDDMK